MGLKIIVMVKQVPDTHNITGEAMKPDGTVNRARLPAIINPEDLNALEEAIRVKERVGGHITAITMGPQKAVQVLKECLYRGADDVRRRGVLVARGLPGCGRNGVVGRISTRRRRPADVARTGETDGERNVPAPLWA